MNQAGILSNDQILELTGEEGGAGIASMAASMTEAGYRMSRSSLGTAMTAALGQVEDGKFTGKMDEELAQRMRRGELSKGELMKLARQKTAGRAGKLSFSAHRERLTSEMVGSVGGEGIGMMMGGILGDRGFDNPDALNLVMQRMGVDERTAEQLISVGKMGSTGELQARQGFETKRLARTAYVNENFSWDAIKKKIGTKIEGMAEAPLKQMGADIRNYFAKVVDEFVDDVTGRYSAEMTKGTAGLLSASAGGSKTAAGLLSGAGSATGMARFGGGAPQIGMAASLTRSVFGLNSSEQGQRALTTNLGMGGLYGKAGAQAGIEAFNKRIDMYAQGVGALRGKSEYQGASQELQEVLRTMPEGLSEEEKLKHIKDKVGGLSDHNNWGQENTTLKQSAVEKLAKASGKNIDEVLASMMSGDKQLSAMSTAVDYKKIGAAIGGMETDLKKVAGERKKLEDSLSGKQGFSAFVSGQNTGAGGLLASGMMHKILGDTGASADEILDILQKKEISPEEWKTLEKKYGITPENKDEAKRLALASKNLKGDDRAGTLEWMNKKINEGVILSSTHQKERSSVYSKLAGLGGKLGEAASAIAGAMTSGSVADMGAIGKLLAGDRKAQSAVGSAGGYEAVEAARAYEESMRDPANRKLSKKDREAKAQQAAQASGSAHQLVPGLSEAGSQFASEAAVKSYFEKLNANQSQITQILGNLAAGKPANEGLTADKKTGS
jgi:hypothetical protein